MRRASPPDARARNAARAADRRPPDTANAADGSTRSRASLAGGPASRPPKKPTKDDPEGRDSTRPANRRVAPQKLPDDLGLAPSASAPASAPASPDARQVSPLLTRRAFVIARALLAAALVVALSGSAAWGARRYVTRSPRFAVKTIEVDGATRRTAEYLAAEARVERGENVFSVDARAAKAALETDPWVKEAQVTRKLPGTVRILVKEREAAAIVVLDGSYLATREGEVFKHLEPGDPADLPIVTGLTEEAVASDRPAAARAVQRALDLAADYEDGPLAGRAPLQEVHLTGTDGVTLVVGKQAIALAMGDPPYRRKLEEASRVLTELEKRGARADTILLDSATRPERVVVRVR